jgi:hypothetical protein
MTEQEWLNGGDLRRMFGFMQWKGTDRKFLLFGVASCRHIGHLLNDERHWEAIEAVEQFAEGSVSVERLELTCSVAHSRFFVAERDYPNSQEAMSDPHLDTYRAVMGLTCCSPSRRATYPAWSIAPSAAWSAAGSCCRAAVPTRRTEANLDEGSLVELAAQVILFREVFGNPFRPVAFDPAWRTPTVTAVAKSIYEDRRFADLPILADALDEAGCSSVEILDHFRKPDDHVRGCWALDLVLARE